MKQLECVSKVMSIFPQSFINRSNELILVPKFNVYFGLNDVETEEDVFCKMCESVSRDCCYALRYDSPNRLYGYYLSMTEKFNAVCGTNFTVKDMETIYEKLGNGCNHERTLKFVRSGFDLTVLKGEH